MRGKSANCEYVVGLMHCGGLYQAWMPLEGQADIYIARNTIVNKFLLETELDNLIFIDSDIGFTRQNLSDLLESSEHYVSGLYPGKGEPAEWIFRDVNGDIMPVADVPPAGMMEAGLIPTGFVKITRHMLDTIAKSGLAPQYGPANKPHYQFFNGRVHKGNLLSEDYSFSRLAIDAGFKPYVNCGIRLTHDGRNI